MPESLSGGRVEALGQSQEQKLFTRKLRAVLVRSSQRGLAKAAAALFQPGRACGGSFAARGRGSGERSQAGPRVRRRPRRRQQVAAPRGSSDGCTHRGRSDSLAGLQQDNNNDNNSNRSRCGKNNVAPASKARQQRLLTGRLIRANFESGKHLSRPGGKRRTEGHLLLSAPAERAANLLPASLFPPRPTTQAPGSRKSRPPSSKSVLTAASGQDMRIERRQIMSHRSSLPFSRRAQCHSSNGNNKRHLNRWPTGPVDFQLPPRGTTTRPSQWSPPPRMST